MDPLDRLYWRLVESLRRERPGASWELTVAEIYQQLVPYRAVRGDLGFAELPEYEHALLRLLSGERDYLSLEIAEVQEELARELRAPNPILGLYRDYAAVMARLNPAPPPAAAAPPRPADPGPDATADPAPPAPPPPPRPSPPAAAHPAAHAAARTAPPTPPSAQHPRPPAPREAPPPRPALCRACRAPLPEGREVRFCPFCGATQRALPCAGCGEPVEPEWKFCIACGLPQRPGVAS